MKVVDVRADWIQLSAAVKKKWNKNKCRCEYLVNKECDKNLSGMLVIVNVSMRKKQFIY